MNILFAVVALIYGVMALHRAITFTPSADKSRRSLVYPMLLASVLIFDALAVYKVANGAGLATVATLPGLAMATAGLGMLSAKAWLARQDGRNASDKTLVLGHLGAYCVATALLGGYFAAPFLRSLLSGYNAGLAAMVAALLAGLLLVGLAASRLQNARDNRAIYRLGSGVSALLAFVAVVLFRLGPSTVAPTHHAVGAALAFLLLVVSGLGAAWSDRRLN